MSGLEQDQEYEVVFEDDLSDNEVLDDPVEQEQDPEPLSDEQEEVSEPSNTRKRRNTAQDRINALVYQREEEKRRNEELMSKINNLETHITQVASVLTAQEEAKLKANLQDAIDSGDTEEALRLFEMQKQASIQPAQPTPQPTPTMSDEDRAFKSRHGWYGDDPVKTQAAIVASQKLIQEVNNGQKFFATREQFFDEVAQMTFTQLNKQSNSVKPATHNAGASRPSNQVRPTKKRIVIADNDPELTHWTTVMKSKDAAKTFLARKRSKQGAN